MKKTFGEYPPDLAVPLVIEYEGFRSKAYLCPAGVWTIGYGHTGAFIRMIESIWKMRVTS